MAGYTRNDTSNNIANGNVIDADDLDGEFNALVSAFNESTGHTHDGTSAEGASITVTGPNQEYRSDATALFPKTDGTYDLGKTGAEWKDLYIDGVANIDSLVADTADINGGTIDGVTIGGASAGAITGTTITGTSLVGPLTGDVTGDLTGDVTGDLTGNVTSTGTSSFATVTVSGTVDGRDLSVDGAKLDGIEAGATADQTAAEIKTAYESNANTNAFTDAEQIKLSGIEASADVTDTANVTAAGALMDSELTDITAVKALDQGVATTDSPSFSGLTVDTNTLSVDSTNNRVGVATATPSTALDVNGTVTATGWSGGTQSEATWEAGTSTTESIVSPAKVKAAIEAAQTEVSEVATTSGTSVDIITGIPSGVNSIELYFYDISISAADFIVIQLGTSVSYSTSGYNGYTARGAGGTTLTSGMPVIYSNADTASANKPGLMRLHRIPGTDKWVSGSEAAYTTSTGSIDLGAQLTRLRVTTNGGTATFDNGGISARYS